MVSGVFILCGMVPSQVGSRNRFAWAPTSWEGWLCISRLSLVAWLLSRAPHPVEMVSCALACGLRHGMANLYRPGNHAASVLVALGIGVMSHSPFIWCRSPAGRSGRAAPLFAQCLPHQRNRPRSRSCRAIPGRATRLQAKLDWFLRPARSCCRWPPVEKFRPGVSPPLSFSRQLRWLESKPDDIQVLRGMVD